jgi:hypothetical protein
MLREPLREIVGEWDDSGNGAGREEGEIGSSILPHGSVEADIHVGRTPSINADLAQSWACLIFVHREIMDSHEG